MAPVNANIYSFLQKRQYGGRRPRLVEAQLTMLRMQPRWSFPNALPRSSKLVKDIVTLGRDAFCLVSKAGRADAFSAGGPSGEAQQLTWLADLRIFGEERVRMAMHLEESKVLLAVFAVAGDEERGTLYIRALDVPAILRSEVQVRSCGEIASIAVPVGGFVEVDTQNKNIVIFDGSLLRCWDTKTFEQRISLGPWTPEEVPNVRFTMGHMAMLRLTEDNSVEIKFHGAGSGELIVQREVMVLPVDQPYAFLELCNNIVLLKREGGDVAVADLLSNSAPHILCGTKDWEPDLFVFLPAQSLLLAYHKDVLEIWRCARPAECQRVGIMHLQDFGPGRFCIDESSASALVIQRRNGFPLGSRAVAEKLLLLDVQTSAVRAALDGTCDGEGGGGIARMAFDLAHGELVLIGNDGGLFSYASIGEGSL